MRTTYTWRGQHSLLEAPAAMAHNLTRATHSFGDDSSPSLLHARNDVSLANYCCTTNPSLIPHQRSLVLGCHYSAASDRNTSHIVYSGASLSPRRSHAAVCRVLNWLQLSEPQPGSASAANSAFEAEWIARGCYAPPTP